MYKCVGCSIASFPEIIILRCSDSICVRLDHHVGDTGLAQYIFDEVPQPVKIHTRNVAAQSQIVCRDTTANIQVLRTPDIMHPQTQSSGVQQ